MRQETILNREDVPGRAEAVQPDFELFRNQAESASSTRCWTLHIHPCERDTNRQRESERHRAHNEPWAHEGPSLGRVSTQLSHGGPVRGSGAKAGLTPCHDGSTRSMLVEPGLQIHPGHWHCCAMALLRPWDLFFLRPLTFE